jgi:predicted transcriptional regulator of viral defense system
VAPDAVLAYHTALEAHGYAQSVFERLFFLTHRKVKPVTFRGRAFVPVAPPQALQRKRLSNTSTVELERRGLMLRATSVERTAVDVLDRPDLAGGLEEAWRSVSAIPLLDLRGVVEYVRLRELATLAVKVGLFLERYRSISRYRCAYSTSFNRFAHAHRTISIDRDAASSCRRGT